jgi:hypothetical protein
MRTHKRLSSAECSCGAVFKDDTQLLFHVTSFNETYLYRDWWFTAFCKTCHAIYVNCPKRLSNTRLTLRCLNDFDVHCKANNHDGVEYHYWNTITPPIIGANPEE